MKSKLTWTILVASALCGTASLAETTSASTTPTNTNAQDGQTIEWIMIVDKNEMAAGKEAMQKSKDPNVKKYARELITDHTKNLSQTVSVSHNIHEKAVESDESKALKQHGKDLMAKLKKLKDKEFDKAYVDAMVSGHSDVLTAIDGKMGQVSNPKLQDHVKMTKDMVQRHLDDGKTVQQSLQ